VAQVFVVVGCGNLARSDDGAGVEVVRRLGARRPADESIRFIDAGTGGIDVVFRLRGAGRAIIVDACRSGSEPGAVFRVPGSQMTTPPQAAFTQHGLRWDHALYAATQMFGADFLRATEVFLIEAGNLDFGIGLSAAVERGVERVVGEIETLLADHGRG
jgi:hydrogenase maturation protease